VLRGGIVLWPERWSTEAYDYVLKNATVRNALGVSVYVTVVGTAVNMVFTTTLAFALSRRELPGRRLLLVLVLFTILFGPGIIPRYLVVKELGLLNTLWSLMLPGAISAFNLIVMRNFFMSLPEELFDAAKIDGANELQLLRHVVLPLSGAVIAAISLFYAVGHWNAFFNAILYLRDPGLWPLQLVLRQIVLSGQTRLGEVELDPSILPPPPFTIQMATLVIATVPILIVYPFVQRYFTKGVLTGAVKG
jgi:putative aldouronate transport system permease protein